MPRPTVRGESPFRAPGGAQGHQARRTRTAWSSDVSGSAGCSTSITGRRHECASILEWHVGSSRVDLQACKLEYSIVSPK